MKINYMKVIANLLFIFIIVNFLLCLVDEKPLKGYIFLWIAVFNMLLYLNKLTNLYIKVIIEVIVILPIIFIGNNITKFIVVFICAIIIYLYKKSNDKISYAETVEEFKKSFFITMFIAIVSWMKFDNNIINEFILSYTIMYLTFIIVILRYLRNYEYNAVNKKMNKFNAIYSVSMIITAFILALKSVRQAILNIFLFIYNGVIDVILYIITCVAMFIDYVFGKIFKGINFKLKTPPKINESSAGSMFGDIKTTNLSFSEAYPSLYNIITIMINIALILLVFYLLTKILRKKSVGNLKKEECIETKEFILAEKPVSKLKNKLKNFFNKGNYIEQIRHYYSRFMEDCINSGIELKETDTTMNIYLKSKESFNKRSLWNMRNIYLQIRYGNKSCTKQEVKEFYELYRKKNE